MVFNNIFSDKPEKLENKNPIIIDTREKQSLILSYLKEKKANVKLETLEIADYLIGDIAIERKTYSDFISSMINKRLLTQLEAIKKYPRYFLLIEGQDKYLEQRQFREDTSKKPQGVLDKAGKGMMLSIITSFKIPIIFSENEEDTANILLMLAKQIEKPNQDLGLRHTPTQLTKKEKKQFILEGFPGIGPVTAKKLLKEFSSLKNIFNADETKLKEILGTKYDVFKELLD